MGHDPHHYFRIAQDHIHAAERCPDDEHARSINLGFADLYGRMAAASLVADSIHAALIALDVD